MLTCNKYQPKSITRPRGFGPLGSAGAGPLCLKREHPVVALWTHLARSLAFFLHYSVRSKTSPPSLLLPSPTPSRHHIHPSSLLSFLLSTIRTPTCSALHRFIALVQSSTFLSLSVLSSFRPFLCKHTTALQTTTYSNASPLLSNHHTIY